jgi:hypothetical protein
VGPGRSEQVQLIDAATGGVLDTETISSFSGGEYLQWAVSGNVLIKVTDLSGPSAVISSLFLDSSTKTTATAATVRPEAARSSDGIGVTNPSALEIGALDFGDNSNGPALPAAGGTSSAGDAAVFRRRDG